MYHIIHVISALIRQLFLPNPFSALFSNQMYADIFNILIGGLILHVLAYIMTGTGYEKNSAPGLGSFLYMVNYCLITGMIVFVTWLINSFWIAVTMCAVFYFLMLMLLGRLSGKRHAF